MSIKHEFFMDKALEMAKKALESGNFPVGAVIVADDEVVGEGSRENSQLKNCNELDHAEMVAIRDWIDRGRIGAGKRLYIYTTLEPCMMCLGAILINGIEGIVYAVEDPMGGACGTNIREVRSFYRDQKSYNNLYLKAKPEIISGIRRMESIKLFYEFYRLGNRYLIDSYLASFFIEEWKKNFGLCCKCNG